MFGFKLTTRLISTKRLEKPNIYVRFLCFWKKETRTVATLFVEYALACSFNKQAGVDTFLISSPTQVGQAVSPVVLVAGAYIAY
jgi:hypothetical protein